MQVLWEAVCARTGISQKATVLFLHLFRVSAEIAEKTVRGMWRLVSPANYQTTLLFGGMREFGSFEANGGKGKWPVCAWGSEQAISSWLVSREANGERTRQILLSRLWEARKEKSSPRSSYQLHQGGYLAAESDYGMQVLPRLNARGEGFSGKVERKTVLSVEDTGRVEKTYNVRVEPFHNYFAGGVLVHNCDDPHSIKEAESEVVRNETVRWFRESMSNRLNDMEKSAIVIIMQRVNEGDVSGSVLDNQMDYTHLCIPMEYDEGRRCSTEIGWEDPREEDGELAWPARFPASVVERMKRDLGPYAFASQYQQAPAPRGGGIFKREWWTPWEPSDGKWPTFDFLLASLDAAFTTKEENDPSGLIVLGVFKHPETKQPSVMLVKAWRKFLEMHGTLDDREPKETFRQWYKRVEFHKNAGLCEWVAETCRFRNSDGVVVGSVDKLLIESKASGITAAQEMQRLYFDEGWGVELVDPKGDKVARAHSVVPTFSAGLVFAPDREWADLVIDEMGVFPKGKHDDLTDAMTMALKWLRVNGLIQRPEEIRADERERTKHRRKQSALYPA